MNGGGRGIPSREEDEVLWARWDSRPEENANEPRGRAESERRRRVWWFGGDCGVEISLARGKQEDGFEEIAGFSCVEVICCLFMCLETCAIKVFEITFKFELPQSYLYIGPFREADLPIQ